MSYDLPSVTNGQHGGAQRRAPLIAVRRVRIDGVATWITSCRVCGAVEFAASWDAALLNAIDHKIQMDAHRRRG